MQIMAYVVTTGEKMADIIEQMMNGFGDIFAKLLNKDKVTEEQIVILSEAAQAGENFYRELLRVIDANQLCMAEDMLSEELSTNYTEQLFDIGVQFYERVGEYSDSELNEYNFSQQEIADGLRYINKLRTNHEELLKRGNDLSYYQHYNAVK